MPNVALAFHVLSERYDAKSFWKPYLDALPSSYDTVMYFNPDEITELKGSPAFGKQITLHSGEMLEITRYALLIQMMH